RCLGAIVRPVSSEWSGTGATRQGGRPPADCIWCRRKLVPSAICRGCCWCV
ncbi:uncharacterized protein METZ01_LOCUS343607, partial [marine metagenome]